MLHQVKRRPKIVALDTMNYWIERTPKELRETLRHTDILMINDSETRQLSNEHNLLLAARHIFKLGPKALVIKRGEYGAMLVHQNRTFSVPAFPLEQVHDPTGAGDTFAGGFMGYLASVKRAGDAELRRAMVYGSVMGSFTVEKFGLDRLRTLKRAEIHARARHFYKMTQFSSVTAGEGATGGDWLRPEQHCPARTVLISLRARCILLPVALSHAQTSQAAGARSGKHDRRDFAPASSARQNASSEAAKTWNGSITG